MTRTVRLDAVRARVLDLCWVLVSATVAVSAADEAESRGVITGRLLFWVLTLTGVGCIALWWRRRYPVPIAVGLAPLLAVADFAGVAVLVAVFTVAVYRRWPVALAVAGLHVVAYVPYSITKRSPDLTVVGANALNIALLAIIVALGVTVRYRRGRIAALHDLAILAETEAEAQAEQLRALERERIAREMHDVLAHRISLLSLHAGALEIRPDLSTDVTEAVGTIRASAHQALDDLREVLGVLRGGDSAGLRPQPGLGDLDELVAESRSTGTPVTFERLLPETAAPASVGRTAYRIVQEGLTNARKHAPGAMVRIRVERTDAGELHVWVCNRLVRGPGTSIPGSHAGLVGIAERVNLAGGHLDHGARRGPGGEIEFHLNAWLPWPI
ncbi:histidine kinase [Actinoplanes sp. NEAU-A12]|uniref:histidine kinase n=1 Tax=Actinoplanes sandaracinus TaxID=3045177 RepID=A0ABT6WZG9_9ACTN|nr:histidine kinase [Actinoplanes sandaracinus]MDI6105148.1 histidine kinase [Actinoplanes sandaracinus]